MRVQVTLCSRPKLEGAEAPLDREIDASSKLDSSHSIESKIDASDEESSVRRIFNQQRNETSAADMIKSDGGDDGSHGKMNHKETADDKKQ